MLRIQPFIIVLSVLLSITFSINASAKDTVIALSPYNGPDTLKAQAATTLEFAVEQHPGDRVIVIDGYTNKPIATISVPTDSRYASPKARLNKNRAALSALLAFSQQSLTVNTSGHPRVIGAVKLPELLRYAAQNYKGTEPLDVIVLGSALYDDPTEPAFSMAEGHFPGDGHINNGSRGQTPFAAKQIEGLMVGMRVHLAFNDALLANDRLNHFIQRFWTLFIEQQSGALVSFEPSMASVFERVKHGAKAPAHNYRLEATDKLEMIQSAPVRIEHASIFDRDLSAAPLSQEQVNRANNLELGISWDCVECDLDIYSMPFPGGPVLYFGNKQTPHGRYWKDYQRSPDTVKGFETIAYQVPLDLSAVITAINFYGGDAPSGVTGEFRIAVDGQTYAAPFEISAKEGHGAKAMEEVMRNQQTNHAQTILIDVLDIVRSDTQG